jgi:hypothetical protein
LLFTREKYNLEQSETVAYCSESVTDAFLSLG